jgi:hypothetical protein
LSGTFGGFQIAVNLGDDGQGGLGQGIAGVTAKENDSGNGHPDAKPHAQPSAGAKALLGTGRVVTNAWRRHLGE